MEIRTKIILTLHEQSKIETSLVALNCRCYDNGITYVELVQGVPKPMDTFQMQFIRKV